MQVPELRRVDSQQRVSETSLPSVKTPVNQPIEAFGGGQEEVERAQDRLLGVVGKVAEQEMARADEVVLTDAKIRASELKNDLIYNPQNGAFTKKGKDAFGIAETYGKQFDDGILEIEKGLNNRQKVFFSKIKNQEKMEFNGNIERHTFQESQAFEKETFNAAIIASRNDMTLNWQNGKVMEGIEGIKLNASKLADMEGMNENAKTLYVDSEVSKGHRSVIERMVANKEVSFARKYKVFYGDSIKGEDATYVDKLLEKGSLDQESKNKADELIRKYPNSLSKQLEQLQSDVQDAALFDATNLRLQQNAATQQRIEREDNENNMKAASLIAMRDGVRPPANLMLKLTIDQNEEIDRWLKLRAKGESPTTDWGLYQELKDMASIGQNKMAFANENLFNYQSRLGSKEFNELLNIQEAIRKNDPENMINLTSGWSEAYEAISKNLKEFDIKTTAEPGEKYYEDVVGYRKAVNDEIEYEKKRQGKQSLSKEELQKIADRILVEHIKTEPGMFYGKNYRLDFSKKNEQPTFSENPDEGIVLGIEDVPLEEADKIRVAYGRKGRTATDRDIIEMWNKKINKALK